MGGAGKGGPDAARARANDYRSRRGQGPDLLNGYRAVVPEIAEDGRVEVTWRTRERGQDDAYVSAWLTPDQIAGGALSLGYAMTIAASQSMTCDTSLLYGHGANAFAAHPGLTRGKKEKHLWLPLAVIESEETPWARLGTARTEEERLERAVDAYARFLGQSRPDSMVSDLFHEPPAPALVVVVPSPTRPRAVSTAAARARSPRRTRRGRTVADDARTGKALRQRIAQQHPELHHAETRARAEVQQAQEAQTARIEQQNRRYQPPAPSTCPTCAVSPTASKSTGPPSPLASPCPITTAAPGASTPGPRGS